MGVEIYWVSGSPYGWRVLLAALLKGVAYESHLLSMSKQEHKSPEFLALSPRGRTPLLKDGDFVLSESVAIVVYLDSLGSRNPLFGSNPRRTAAIWEAVFEIAGDFERAAVGFWEPILYAPASAEFGRGGEEGRREAASRARLSGSPPRQEQLSRRGGNLGGRYLRLSGSCLCASRSRQGLCQGPRPRHPAAGEALPQACRVGGADRSDPGLRYHLPGPLAGRLREAGCQAICLRKSLAG